MRETAVVDYDVQVDSETLNRGVKGFEVKLVANHVRGQDKGGRI